jgi:hypothetical protein
MKNWTDEQVKGKVLNRLLRLRKVEHSHTAIEHLQKGFPKDMAGRVKALVQELVKEGLLHVKQTSYGVQVSINIEKSEHVNAYRRVFLDEEAQDKHP